MLSGQLHYGHDILQEFKEDTTMESLGIMVDHSKLHETERGANAVGNWIRKIMEHKLFICMLNVQKRGGSDD